MAKPFGEIKVDGLKEFQRSARRAADTELPKRLGQVNKRIGALVISRLQPRPDPAAVGEGAGASVRPSASKREVLLRVGGKHRAGRTPQMQWGKRPGRRVGSGAPKRPFIRETVERHREEIEQAWLQAVSDAMSGPFHDTEP